MTSQELADALSVVVVDAMERITGTGKSSYGSGEVTATPLGSDKEVVIAKEDDYQRFETETLGDELNNLEEELLDTINWAAMAVVKLRERRSRLAKANRTHAPAGDTS